MRKYEILHEYTSTRVQESMFSPLLQEEDKEYVLKTLPCAPVLERL